MRKTLVLMSLSAVLVGAPVAAASPASAAPTSVLAVENDQAGQGDDRTGLWGLLGLLGLAGLIKRKDTSDTHDSARR